MNKVNEIFLRGDRWNGTFNHEWRQENPSEADFEHALQQLDAVTYTMLTIQAGEDAHLAIAGGRGQYVVYATFDNEDFWNLLRPDETSGTVMLNAGGQEGDFPANQVVTMEQARIAGMTFLHSRRLDLSQKWERQ